MMRQHATHLFFIQLQFKKNSEFRLGVKAVPQHNFIRVGENGGGKWSYEMKAKGK